VITSFTTPDSRASFPELVVDVNVEGGEWNEIGEASGRAREHHVSVEHRLELDALAREHRLSEQRFPLPVTWLAPVDATDIARVNERFSR
jgi:hypothetical protein